MSRRLSLAVAVAMASGLLLSCAEVRLPHEPSVVGVGEPLWSVGTGGPPPYDLPPGSRSRWDAPWWAMDDVALADSIESLGGLAFIGFKEPGARGGVDDWGRVLVSHASAVAGKDMLRRLGLSFDLESRLMPVVAAVVPRSLVATIRAHPLIDYITPVGRVQFEAQDTTWNVQRVRAPEAWTSSDGSGVKLLVIDSGTPNDHPDLSPAVIQACDGSNGIDQNGHGTHVAGIAAAVDNSVHLVGVSHGVQLWSSKTDLSALSVYCAVEFGRINGVSVINMSFATTETQTLTDMIKGAYQDGIFIAKSAGNTNGGPVTYPGNLAETVAVTALDVNNVRFGGAAISPHVELAAPGVSIVSTMIPNGSHQCASGSLTATCSGTSMAAPHVAAAAAILKSFNSSWTNSDIRERLQNTAVDLGSPGRNNEYGFGLIDIRAALDWSPIGPPLSVQILGPTAVRPNESCTWSAQHDGDPPFVYSWMIDGIWAGSDSWATGGKHAGNLASSFTVTVDVTADGNRSGFASVIVHEDPNAMFCIL